MIDNNIIIVVVTIILIQMIRFFMNDLWEIIRIQRRILPLCMIIIRRFQLIVEYIIIIASFERMECPCGIRRISPVMP